MTKAQFLLNKNRLSVLELLLITFILSSCGSTKKTQVSNKSEERKKEIYSHEEKAAARKIEQKEFTPSGYIDAYKDLAIIEMKRTGIPASITLAQGILESNYGKSILAKKGNNHFGIKCKSNWSGRSVRMDDDEENECFRAYNNALESYRDHSDFLVNGYRYKFLFDLKPDDYKNWAKGLKKAGYATNPRYADILISLIQKYHLDEYDKYYRKPYEIEDFYNEETLADSEKEENNDKVGLQEVIDYNGVPAIYAREGDTWESISEKFDLLPRYLINFNDLEKDAKVKKGMLIYLKPKRGKPDKDFHIVKEGESMHSISQTYTIKLKKLYKFNRMDEGYEPVAGERINLRKKADNPPQMLTHAEWVKEKEERIEQQEIAKRKEQEIAQARALEKTEKTQEPEKNLTEEINPAKKQLTENEDAPENIAKPVSMQQQPEDQIVNSNESKGEPEDQNPVNKKQEEVKVSNQTIKTNPIPDSENGDYIVHTVRQGETLYQLSRNYNVSLEDLRNWNDLSNNAITIGLEIKIYNGKSIMGHPIDDTDESNFSNANAHVVQPGESLYSIAQNYNLTVTELMEMNNLTDYNIHPGQKLRIQEETKVVSKYHTVQKGETLYSIAREYTLSVRELRQLNGLDSNDLKIGQKLVVK